MKHLIDVRHFHGPLAAAGLVPDNCRVLDLSIGVEGALSISYEVLMTAEQLITLGAVFQEVGTSILATEAAMLVERKKEPTS